MTAAALPRAPHQVGAALIVNHLAAHPASVSLEAVLVGQSIMPDGQVVYTLTGTDGLSWAAALDVLQGALTRLRHAHGEPA